MAQGQMNRVIDRVRKAALLGNGAAMSDGQLLECFIAGRDEAAFEALVRRHAGMVHGVCRRVVGHAQDAEDAFQATFIVLVRKAATIMPREAVGSWLHGVAYRTALEARSRGQRLRSREKQVKDLPQLASRAAPAAGSEHLWSDLKPLLDRELSRLPDKYRLPVVLCDLEGRCREEVSLQLDLPEGTLSSRLARGRRMLAGRLARRGLALSAGTLAVLLAQEAASASVPAPLVISTVEVATLIATGQAATGAISAGVAALTEGVLHAMFIAKIKTATLVLTLVALFGSSAGFVTHRVFAGTGGAEPSRLVERDAADPLFVVQDDVAREDAQTAFVGREDTPRVRPDVMGRIVAVAKDGKSITVETQPARGGRDGGDAEPAKKLDVKITGDTKVVYSAVGVGGAKLTEGYGAQVWLASGSKDIAAQLHLSGKQAERNAPNLSGIVSSVSNSGKTLSFKVAPRGRNEPEASLEVKLTDKTSVVYDNVDWGRAKPTVGFHAEVWLVEGSKDTAEKVAFRGNAETFSRENPPPRPDITGKVVTALKGVLVVETPAANRGDEPVRHNITLTDKTSEIYFRIGQDGDRRTVGYLAQIWLADGAKDTAAKVHFQAADRPNTGPHGKVIGIGKEGKSITLEQPGKERGDPPTSVDIKLAAKARLVFNGVGPEGAVLSEGMLATAILEEGSSDTAIVVVIGPARGER